MSCIKCSEHVVIPPPDHHRGKHTLLPTSDSANLQGDLPAPSSALLHGAFHMRHTEVRGDMHKSFYAWINGSEKSLCRGFRDKESRGRKKSEVIIYSQAAPGIRSNIPQKGMGMP